MGSGHRRPLRPTVARGLLGQLLQHALALALPKSPIIRPGTSAPGIVIRMIQFSGAPGANTHPQHHDANVHDDVQRDHGRSAVHVVEAEPAAGEDDGPDEDADPALDPVADQRVEGERAVTAAPDPPYRAR